MPATPSNTTQLAVIISNLINIQAKLLTIETSITNLSDQVSNLKVNNATNQANITTLKTNVQDLEKKSNTWDITNSILAFLAGLATYISNIIK